MKLGFSDEVEIFCAAPIDQHKLTRLAERIRTEYGVKYRVHMTENGFIMKPTGSDAMIRNSFWPVLEGTVQGDTLTLRRRIIYFAHIWLGAVAAFQVVFICAAGIHNPQTFIPLGMLLFGYLLFKVFSEFSGRPILKCAMDVLQE